MLNQTKYLWIAVLLLSLALVAAQCGGGAAAPEGAVDHEEEVHDHEEAAHDHEEAAHDHEEAAHDHEEEAHDHEEAAHDHKIAFTPVSLGEGQKLKVVATTGIVADVVKQVGGELIELTTLLPPGTDPHTFTPAPRDLSAVADAHLVFASGMGLEGFLEDMIQNAGGQAAVVHLSAGIEPRQFVEKAAAPESSEEETEDHHHHHEGADPHTWTSPANVMIFVDNIEQALSSLDPAQAEAYEANAAAYRTELKELDRWVKAQIEQIPPENRELVTDHTAFGYYADRYGLTQIGAVIPAFSTAAEPSAGELAQLEQAIEEYEVPAIFVGNTVNSSLSEQVAADTGVKLVRLYTGSLGPPGDPVQSYLDYIRYNTNAIVEGLQ